MDEWVRDRIKAEAEMIRDEIRGGKLYGQPVDESDVDMLIVAAYNAGMLLAGGGLVFELPASLKDVGVQGDLPKESTELPEMSIHNAQDAPRYQPWIGINDLPDMSDDWARVKLTAESGSREK